MEDKVKKLQWFENIIKYDINKHKFNIIDFFKSNKNSTCFNSISIFDDIERGTIKEDKEKVKKLLEIFMKEGYKDKEKKEKIKILNFKDIELRSIGSILGMAIGDAMGSRLEFKYYIPEDELDILIKNGSKIEYLQDMGGNKLGGHFNLEPGQWTDDTSMGLCLADSLLVNGGKLDKYDLMNRFIAWWNGGYNNAFRLQKKPRHSVGLGGNISLSFRKYMKEPVEKTTAGNKNTSGNGSIMRNAAIPICFKDEIKKACHKAKEQSLTTHQGIQAMECCNILTYIIVKVLKGEELKHVLDNLKVDDILDKEEIEKYPSAYQSIICLINSEEEKDSNENWNWRKNEIYQYNQERAKKQPGYIGSYAMDNLVMSLNIVYRTNNFRDAIIKAVNLRGDADSVASVVGQIAGAAYPLEIPSDWIKAVNKWDDGEIALRGYMLSRLNKESSYCEKLVKKEKQEK